jgi:hypothetical protein
MSAKTEQSNCHFAVQATMEGKPVVMVTSPSIVPALSNAEYVP